MSEKGRGTWQRGRAPGVFRYRGVAPWTGQGGITGGSVPHDRDADHFGFWVGGQGAHGTRKLGGCCAVVQTIRSMAERTEGRGGVWGNAIH